MKISFWYSRLFKIDSQETIEKELSFTNLSMISNKNIILDARKLDTFWKMTWTLDKTTMDMTNFILSRDCKGIKFINIHLGGSGYLESNPNLNFSFVSEISKHPCRWDSLFANSMMTIPNIQTLLATLSKNRRKKHREEIWAGISQNPNLTMEFVNSNLDKPLVWEYIFSFMELSAEFISQNLHKGQGIDVNTQKILLNPHITMEFIEKYFPNGNWEFLPLNPNFDLKMCEKYPNIKWNKMSLLKNENVSKNLVEHIIKEGEKMEKGLSQESWKLLSGLDLPLSFFRKYSKLPWQLAELSKNRNLTLKFIRNFKGGIGQWDWRRISDIIGTAEKYPL